jgi:hypothetical protein
MNLSSGRVAVLLGSVVAAFSSPAITASIPNQKAGVASAVYLDSAPQKLVALGATWAYDWSAVIQPTTPGLQWVPMVWGKGFVTPQIISNLQQAQAAGSARYLLGFNEPDNSSQANLTPQQAAALWPQLEQTGLILGSPAPTTPTDNWLPRFMRLVHQRHLRVNFIALHYYIDFTNPGAVAAMRAQLIQVHNAYHLPIWITELGALDIHQWGQPMLHPQSAAFAETFMRNVFAMLNALPFVQRYAWYTDSCASQSGCRYSSLFNDSGAVTAEGRQFKSDA